METIPPKAPSLKPSALRLLEQFRRRPVLTAVECMNAAGLDWRKRISELRRAGYEIGSAHIEGKAYHRYRLEASPASAEVAS